MGKRLFLSFYKKQLTGEWFRAMIIGPVFPVPNHTETYRSGHNGLDSKSNAVFGSAGLKNLDTAEFLPGS